ncbi:hypothetical protein FIBSPDRAFT_873598 [Athelia psychrophila]|uniref:Uncharacterized protein n=1 Tax=Athelia psychrophila TaxID=1759441 RepID=A0A165YCY8_9AGAM|nr:hypothetical protein FIBSPDRAFT_873598 [Fibularhizoctonia sp. CBS 109695]
MYQGTCSFRQFRARTLSLILSSISYRHADIRARPRMLAPGASVTSPRYIVHSVGIDRPQDQTTGRTDTSREIRER